MGGSGGGGWSPTVPSSPCERLSFRANINSPQPALSSVSVGDRLDLSLQTSPLSVIALFNGTIVGSITGPSISGLINCMQNGYQYEAEVLTISGGNCSVLVRHV